MLGKGGIKLGLRSFRSQVDVGSSSGGGRVKMGRVWVQNGSRLLYFTLQNLSKSGVMVWNFPTIIPLNTTQIEVEIIIS